MFSGAWEKGVRLTIWCDGGENMTMTCVCTWEECGVTRHAHLFVLTRNNVHLQLFPSDTLLNSKVYENAST